MREINNYSGVRKTNLMFSVVFLLIFIPVTFKNKEISVFSLPAMIQPEDNFKHQGMRKKLIDSLRVKGIKMRPFWRRCKPPAFLSGSGFPQSGLFRSGFSDWRRTNYLTTLYRSLPDFTSGIEKGY
ncbi:MAG: hypothetical protein U0X76_01565 [Bacteroidia bacterium]